MSFCRCLRVFNPDNAVLFSYLVESTDYFGVSPLLLSSNLPSNDTIKGLAEGLAEAHRAYGLPECVLLEFPLTVLDLTPCKNSAHVLFVVQPNERNIFDQRMLEYQLFESCIAFSHHTSSPN